MNDPLKPFQTSWMIVRFYKNSFQLKAVDYFGKKARS